MRFLDQLLWAIAILGAGCLRSTEYKCTSTDQCGASGVCETSVGFCSFPDPQCGRRFGDSAGTLSNQCVGGQPQLDAGLDGPSNDGPLHDGPMPDGMMIDGGTGCPSGYATITGGGTHLYKVVGSNDWNTSSTTCSGTTPLTYLAIPDSAGEVSGYDTLITSGTYWVGISEAGGNFTNVKGATQVFLPWAPGQPNSTGNSHCAEATASGTDAGKLDLTRCGDAHPAICECEP